MPQISFIMPAKNEEDYISQAIDSLIMQAWKDWELIVIDDSSEDRTLAIAQGWSRRDRRIRCISNTGKGIISALNCGFSQAQGDSLKMIDADDILDPSFSRFVPILISLDASYHDAMIVDDNLKRISPLRNRGSFQTMDLRTAIRNIMVSPPRWAWTFRREVADLVFPLPRDMVAPHEDIYIALSMKKNASISYVPKQLYQYRQHSGQIYGGIFNFKREVVLRRAKSVLSIIDALEKQPIIEGLEQSGILIPAKSYYGIMEKEKVRWRMLLSAPLSLKQKMKLVIVKRAPNLASMLSRIKSCL